MSLSSLSEALRNLRIYVQPTTSLLGSGSYGKVFEVEFGGKACAGKQVHPWMLELTSKEEQEMVKQDFLQECHLWSTLRHPNIVQFLGIYYPSDDKSGLPVMVMEKMHESVTSLIEKHDNISSLVKLSILHDVSLGLRYLHGRSPQIVHRDLSPNNILVTPHFEAKITDLGVAKAIMTENSIMMTKSPGNTIFMPPEALDDQPVYGPSLDVFSFGCVIVHVTSRQWPTPKAIKQIDPKTRKQITLSEVERRQRYIDMMSDRDVDLKPLVVSCLDDDPLSRPEMSVISEMIKKMKDSCSNKAIQGTTQSSTKMTKEFTSARPQQKAVKEDPTAKMLTGSMTIKWEERAPLPVASAMHTAVLYNNIIYVGGGSSTHNDDCYQMYSYHPETNIWDLPIVTPHSYYAMTVLVNKLVIVGGLTKNPKRATNKVLVFEGRQWNRYTEMPTKRHSTSAISHQSMMIVMGGKGSKETYGTTELLDDSTGQWFTCNNLPRLWHRLKSVILGNTLYILGGKVDKGFSVSVYAACLDTLSSHQLLWQRLSSVPWPCPAAVVVNDTHLLAVGGAGSTDTVCVLKSEGSMLSSTSWESVGSLPTMLYFPAAVNYGNQIIVIGGYDKDVIDSTAVYTGTFQ